ncbi:MAG: hypothetical protein WCY29_17455 [Novosphingobium sp.]
MMDSSLAAAFSGGSFGGDSTGASAMWQENEPTDFVKHARLA